MTLLAGLDAPLDTPLSGLVSPTSAEVPGRFEVSIAGHAYMVDRAQDLTGFRGTHLARKSIPLLRAQADTTNTPGEQSLNRDADWRRVQESWHHGAGQVFFDRDGSDLARFASSKGVDVWSKWSMSLLADTSQQLASANTNLRLTACGTYTYLADGNSLKFTTDITANPVVWTTVTGTPASPLLWLTSDGKTVYAAYATDVYSTAGGTAAAVVYNATDATLLGFTLQRLMAAKGPALYNILDAATTTTLLTHPNSDFQWVGFAEGPGYIYAAGYSGNKSAIYKIALKTDGTALDSPIVAGVLPTGETIRSIKGYVGMLVIGTDLGVRIASIDANGYLTLGSYIPTPGPVLNFEPAGVYVWFGWTNYDGVSTGLGRLDLTAFTAPLTPAYASDLMATTQGSVLSISSQGTRRCFTVSGVGVFVESLNRVPTGTLTSSRISYGIGDPKVATSVDLRHSALAGTVAVSLAVDGATAVAIGSSDAAGSTQPPSPLNAGQVRGEFFALTVTLTRAAAITTGPSVTRYTLRTYPAPTRAASFTVPLILQPVQDDLNGNEFSMDVQAERTFLEGLWRSQVLFAYQEGGSSYTVLLDDFVWAPIKFTPDRSGYQGTFIAELKEVS